MKSAGTILKFALLAVAVPALAQQGNIQHAKLETRSAASGLQQQVDAVVRQGSAAWIAWQVPSIHDNTDMCCYNSRGDHSQCGCALENNGGVTVNSSDQHSTAPVKLENADFEVFVRAESGHIQKVRTMGVNCPVDAQNMPVYWLSDVKPADSVRLLTTVAEQSGGDGEKRPADGAVLAIAMTKDASADAALDQLIDAKQPEWLRKKVAFWLGMERGASGLNKLLALMKSDQNDSFRKELVFPISQSKAPGAEDELMRIAKEDSSTGVREQAIFWLAQRAGAKVAAMIKDTVDNDPNTEVKKRAVFALSQMPTDQGIPLLIQVAKNNANSQVRKQAIFWLGQSHDPRALDYIESVLKQ
ncbi:MAG: HEAT repeat domain-containing protein [Terriglobales bacterium]